MVANTKKCLKSLASVLKVDFDQRLLEDDNKITSNIFTLVSKSEYDLGGRNHLEKAEIQQYIEYGIVYVSQASSAQDTGRVLQDLNGFLSLKTYLIANRLTVADLFLYYVLYSIMESLSVLEKEKYLNLCRWFDNVQLNPNFKLSKKLIDFSTNFLASLVPARH